MRLLLVVDDPKIRSLARHHASCRWPDVRITAHPPMQRGPIPIDFLAQGYDAVLLAAESDRATLQAVMELSSRGGFAPVIALLDSDTEAAMGSAHRAGAFGAISRRRIEHDKFIELLDQASQHQRKTLADWRISPEATESRRFGEAIIPGYRRARLLARGSVSYLFVAESEKAGNLVVLKVTPSERDETGVDQAFARFLQEYEIARRVRHPNVVRLYELGIADDHAYLAMEYFPAGDLRRRMRARLSVTEALSIAAQVARALWALHGGGILHRDLKPGNVMLRNDGQVALIDFGLAKHAALAMEITDTGLIFGTPHYMSPEQGHGQDLDPRSDLYSLGIMLYEMLTGTKPYTGENPMAIIYMHRNAPLPQLPEPLADLQPLIDRLLGKLPQDRFDTAADAAEALQAMRAARMARETHD